MLNVMSYVQSMSDSETLTLTTSRPKRKRRPSVLAREAEDSAGMVRASEKLHCQICNLWSVVPKWYINMLLAEHNVLLA